jgi:hypothetical protein
MPAVCQRNRLVNRVDVHQPQHRAKNLGFPDLASGCISIRMVGRTKYPFSYPLMTVPRPSTGTPGFLRRPEADQLLDARWLAVLITAPIWTPSSRP